MMEMPSFDVPKMEVPAAFREFAEKSVSQAKDNWEKMKAVTEDATDMIETSYSTASKGASDYGLALIDAARSNTNAAFDFCGQIMTAKALLDQGARAVIIKKGEHGALYQSRDDRFITPAFPVSSLSDPRSRAGRAKSPMSPR